MQTFIIAATLMAQGQALRVGPGLAEKDPFQQELASVLATWNKPTKAVETSSDGDARPTPTSVAPFPSESQNDVVVADAVTEKDQTPASVQLSHAEPAPRVPPTQAAPAPPVPARKFVPDVTLMDAIKKSSTPEAFADEFDQNKFVKKFPIFNQCSVIIYY